MRTPGLVSLLFLSLLFSCSGNEESLRSGQAGSSSTVDIVSPKITLLADLPDSLQPRKIMLDLSKPALKVAVPVKKGESYTYNKPNGEVQKVNLEPPVRTIPPMLKNEQGDVIFDQEGKSFILGDGGISNFTRYTSDNGLPGDNIYYTYLDRSGNLWISALTRGVTRYDGINFTTFTETHGLAGNNVVYIMEDRQDHLWFCTWGDGISRYDGTTFTNFTMADELAGNIVWSAAEDQSGHIWFATEGGGVSRYDGSHFTTYDTSDGLASNYVRSIFKDQNDHLWLGTFGGGVSRYDGSHFTTYNTSDGLASDDVFYIAEDQDGRLWLGTGGGGLSRYNPATDSFTNYSTKDGLANNSLRAISTDQSGNLWFGTEGGGISRYVPDSDRRPFITYTNAQGLAGNDVRSITNDQKGYLWIGTFGRGISRYNGPSFTIYTTEQGLAGNIIWGIMKDQKGDLWFNSWNNGITQFDGESFTTFTAAQGMINSDIFDIAEDNKGDLWLGTYGYGLVHYDGSSFTTFTSAQGLASDFIRTLFVDQDGYLWLGTNNAGIMRLHPDKDQTTLINYTTAQGLAGNTITSIGEDQAGNLWFGTWGDGVSRFDGHSFINFTTAHGLAGNLVNDIINDEAGNLYLATRGGLSILNSDQIINLTSSASFSTSSDGKLAKITFGNSSQQAENFFLSFTSANGLSGNDISSLLLLPENKMAVGSEEGITFFNKPSDTLSALDSLEGIEVFSAKGGFPLKNVGPMCLDQDGLIWAGTDSEYTALVRFDYKAVVKNENPPKVSIHQIQINKENISWYNLTKKKKQGDKMDSLTAAARIVEEATIFGRQLKENERFSWRQKFSAVSLDSVSKFYFVPQGLVLPYRHNDITIHFGANELARPGLVVYQHKLEGYDSDWSPVIQGASATFGNIREGTYTFKVKARYTGPSLNNAGEWTEPVIYTFQVLPPWYRSWWAYTVYFLLFGVGLYTFARWRTVSLRRQRELLRTRIDEQTQELRTEKERSDELLLNILPSTVAQELKLTGKTHPDFFEEVSIMFADFKGFTNIVASIPGKKLVSELDDIFQRYDDIMEEVGLEKIQTIGDAYLAACGLPTPDPDHAIKCVAAAQKIIEFLKERNQTEGIKWSVRVGIHSGPITAGVIGKKKFSYDLFGDTINIAARIESSSEPGRINVSAYTYTLIKDHFPCTYRGKIDAKGKGELDMYFVD